jgi:hypothetical protein
MVESGSTRARNPASGKPQSAASEVRSRDAGDEGKWSIEGSPDGAVKRNLRGVQPGFDPYSSDGGYAKPRGWDDVQHK